MAAKYLVRFDDICPTMNWKIWDQIETFLVSQEIRPILAIVPDNGDTDLITDKPNPDFWKKVQYWQGLGWTIGVHGLNHRINSTSSGLLKFNRRSEFADLLLSEQTSLLTNSISIFESNGIKPDMFIAPFHSFDQNTILALFNLDIRFISDGFFLYPRRWYYDCVFIPQQLWKFRKRFFGVWTVCYHHNNWQEEYLLRFYEDVLRYKNAIISASQIIQSNEITKVRIVDVVIACHIRLSLKMRNTIASLIK